MGRGVLATTHKVALKDSRSGTKQADMKTNQALVRLAAFGFGVFDCW
jgi:hypothetical protein